MDQTKQDQSEQGNQEKEDEGAVYHDINQEPKEENEDEASSQDESGTK